MIVCSEMIKLNGDELPIRITRQQPTDGPPEYRARPILAATDRSALFACALGMIVTCIFFLGLLERRDRTVLGMGVDSLLVLIVYVAGLGGLYYLR